MKAKSTETFANDFAQKKLVAPPSLVERTVRGCKWVASASKEVDAGPTSLPRNHRLRRLWSRGTGWPYKGVVSAPTKVVAGLTAVDAGLMEVVAGLTEVVAGPTEVVVGLTVVDAGQGEVD